MTTNPRDLTVTTCNHPEHDVDTCRCGDPDHIWIEVRNNFDVIECDDLPAVLDSYRWTAHLIARLALALADDLDHDRRHHNCQRDNPNDTRPTCGVTLDGRLTWHSPDHIGEGTGPELSITIPTARLKHYRRRIQRTLADIAKSDNWTPSHTQQAAWTYSPDPHATPAPRQPNHQESHA